MPPIFHVDAFTAEQFKGNPAAVVLLNESASEFWMQNVAAEMNLSETAFVSPAEQGYTLRWFTPKAEVDLCGHATLASAHVLFETGALAEHQTARFFTKSGLLSVKKIGELLEMDFPAEPATEMPLLPVLAHALGHVPTFTAQNRMDILVEVHEPEILIGLSPDFYELAQIPVRGIIVTSRSNDQRFDFFSRFFAPRLGVNEDPVTGSAHCCLGPYWATRLHKNSLVGYQASRRGGIVHVSVQHDRVQLAGHAVTILRGELNSP